MIAVIIKLIWLMFVLTGFTTGLVLITNNVPRKDKAAQPQPVPNATLAGAIMYSVALLCLTANILLS